MELPSTEVGELRGRGIGAAARRIWACPAQGTALPAVPRPPPHCPLEQWSPTFLAPGTGFLEDGFSTDQGLGLGIRERMVREGDVGNGERPMKLGARPPLTCCESGS